jgi:hypothetical protein
MVQDLLICLQEATLYFIFRKSWIPKSFAQCFVNLPCGCQNPGKEIKCEDCPYLEACLSSWKLHQDYLKQKTNYRSLRK